MPPHGLKHARLPCPLLSPRVYSNSHPLSRWSSLTISSFATPFSSFATPFCFCLQSFPASGSFPMSWFIRWTKVDKVSELQLQPQSFNDYSGLISSRTDSLEMFFCSATVVLSVSKHIFFLKWIWGLEVIVKVCFPCWPLLSTYIVKSTLHKADPKQTCVVNEVGLWTSSFIILGLVPNYDSQGFDVTLGCSKFFLDHLNWTYLPTPEAG